ncbi:hypothetical protein BAY61_08945 [Prauserella marina]|uniref:Uncharacterized protein n=1 Tax=Prauserella marina TaxID=530584 RepID=A0A222VMV7_9PSEU|nr:hypothetical protein [Prauserella marina]ASR35083.1 hypothetical protein BAY61_08945 [Prauserella marina]PWV85165.1 hypothetical protein DES30_1011188 [Prauserella marina]SDC03307.1 hypothetical protein SAMN05421630_101150 [Prauserella marina]
MELAGIAGVRQVAYGLALRRGYAVDDLSVVLRRGLSAVFVLGGLAARAVRDARFPVGLVAPARRTGVVIVLAGITATAFA